MTAKKLRPEVRGMAVACLRGHASHVLRYAAKLKDPESLANRRSKAGAEERAMLGDLLQSVALALEKHASGDHEDCLKEGA